MDEEKKCTECDNCKKYEEKLRKAREYSKQYYKEKGKATKKERYNKNGGRFKTTITKLESLGYKVIPPNDF